jgi:hypothetical protein
MAPHGDDTMQITFQWSSTEPDYAKVLAYFSIQIFHKLDSCTELFSIQSLVHLRDSSMSKPGSADKKGGGGGIQRTGKIRTWARQFSIPSKNKDTYKNTRKIFTTFTSIYSFITIPTFVFLEQFQLFIHCMSNILTSTLRTTETFIQASMRLLPATAKAKVSTRCRIVVTTWPLVASEPWT